MIRGIIGFFEFKKLSKKIEGKRLFFFFPAYHLGGAERVHVDILTIFKDFDCLCIFTEKSKNNHFEDDFKRAADTFQLKFLRRKPRKYGLKKIADAINLIDGAIVFGCNNHFFYDLLPFLHQSVKVIDLCHAFSYERPRASEKYSLACVGRIDKRIVLGEKTKSDFLDLYKKNNIDESYINNIVIIKNKIDVPDRYTEKNTKGNLLILYVGRNSSEKRAHLIFLLAKKCHEMNYKFDFKIIGDFKRDDFCCPNTEIVGPIKSRELLNTYYSKGHIILISSSREGFPMVLLESMSYGVVPISTDVGEIPEFINDTNKNGYLIKNSDNEDSIVEGFLEVLIKIQSDSSVLQVASNNAYCSVREHFSAEKNREAYLKVFGLK